MPPLLRHSLSLYRRVMAVYPPDLRAHFGSEMVHVFQQQADAAWQETGMAGIAALWWRVLCEVVRGPVLDRMRVPAVSLLSSVGLFLWFAWVAGIAKHCK